MYKVLITGVAGQIGSRLALRCLEKGWKVVGIDNLISGNVENIDPFKYNKNFTFYDIDVNELTKDICITTKKKIISILNISSETDKVNFIFHLAGIADIVDSIFNPKEYYINNTLGTMSIMEFARKIKAEKVIYAASSSCYGDNPDVPTREANPINCKYPYAFTKWQGETIVRHWGQVYKIPYVSLRLFNVYSPYCIPNNMYGAVIKVFIKQWIEKKPFTIIGDGNQKRDFCHVDDVCNAFILSATRLSRSFIFNIGAGNPHSINYLAELIANENPWINIPERKGEPNITYADISKAKKYLGWEPKIKLEDGVEEIKINKDNYKNAPLWEKDMILEKQDKWNKYIGG